MLTTWKSLALLAVTVPATAYVVLETVVDEPETASRPVVVLADTDRTEPTSGTAGRPNRDPGRGSGPAVETGAVPPCDDDGEDDRDDRDDDDRDDVPVVRPCPTEVGEDDDSGRADDLFEDDGDDPPSDGDSAGDD